MPNRDRLTALDAGFLHLERSGAHMHVAGVLVFEGEAPAYDELVEAIEARMHLVPRYRQKLAHVPYGQGRPVWVDDPHFNARYHVRHSALPSPGSDEQLRNLAGRLFALPLDRTKPLWELNLVEGLEGDRFAIISKTHHALVDGVSGVDITSVLFDVSPDATPPAAAEAREWVPRPEPSDAELLAQALVERATVPAEGARGLRALTRAPRQVLGQAGEWLVGVGAMAWAGLSPAPPSPFNVPIGPHRRYTWVDSEVARFKAIKNALGGTLNDVVLSAVTLALGRFLRRRGVETDGLVLKAMVPVSVRADTQRGALGNRVAAMWAPLPVGRHRSRGGARRGRRGDARDQGVRAGRRRRGADLPGRLRAADDHVAGRAAAGAPALLQPRRHQRPGPADPALPARAPDDPLLSRRAARPPPGAGHRDHEL